MPSYTNYDYLLHVCHSDRRAMKRPEAEKSDIRNQSSIQ